MMDEDDRHLIANAIGHTGQSTSDRSSTSTDTPSRPRADTSTGPRRNLTELYDSQFLENVLP